MSENSRAGKIPALLFQAFDIKTGMMITNENNSLPYMKTLASCLNKMNEEGYTDEFKAMGVEGLLSLQTGKLYRPEDVKIVNFYRFEGVSDPEDMSILYVIETTDGLKGTLVDAYGTYASPEVGRFVLEVEGIRKKVNPEEKK